MPATFLFLSIVVSAQITLRILSQTAMWQRKEYRLDRLWSLLTTSERWTVLSYWWFIALVTQVASLIAWAQHYVVVSQYLAGITLASVMTQQIVQIMTRGVFRPHATVKGLTIVVGSAGLLFGLADWFLNTSLPGLVSLSLMSVLVPVTVAVAVALVNLPFAWRKEQIITQATQARKKLTTLQAVGITGSYGKTSTKFFLEQLLADEPDVVVSAKHRNSALTIAQDFLARVKTTTKIYVAEMAAYRVGEIAAIAAVVQPQIGLITAIGNQHLALFGSLEAILAAKWELIAALPATGTAILNKDDAKLRFWADKSPAPVLWYSTTQPADVFIRDVAINPTTITGQLHIKEFASPVTIPLLSEAMLSSALAAVALAYTLGVTPMEIIKHLQALKPFHRTMELGHNSRGTTIIDDSYSGNEAGVAVAITHLKRFSEARKLIVLTPLIELGEAGPEVHRRLGALLANSGAEVILTNATYAADIMSGGEAVRSDFTAQVMAEPKQLAQYLKGHLQSDMVVLLEGRPADVVRQAALS